jgi:DNA-binding MarR family transcriptional regulator
VAATISSRLSSDELSAWRGFLRVHSEITRQLDAELVAEHDLPLTSFEVLMYLAGSPDGRLRMSELAESVLLSPSGATRLVDRLEKRGLVERGHCTEDARGSFAVITDEGRTLFAEARGTHLAGVRQLFLGRLPDADLSHLAAAWERVLPGVSA